MKGQLAKVSWKLFAAIMSNWSPGSKCAVSKGAHKPNLTKFQVRLVLLKKINILIPQNGRIFAKQISLK